MGGAPLLGTAGVTIIAHGASSPKAIKNAIRVANDSVQRGFNRQIGESLQSLKSLPEIAALAADDRRGRKIWSQLRQRFGHSKDQSEEPESIPKIERKEKTDIETQETSE